MVVNNSPLMKRAQMYEFTAESAQEKKKWEDNIENAMNGKCKERQREGKEKRYEHFYKLP